MKWMTMDSAPRVIGANAWNRGPAILVCNESGDVHIATHSHHGWMQGDVYAYPVFWMPLPEPPSQVKRSLRLKEERKARDVADAKLAKAKLTKRERRLLEIK